MKWDLQSLEGKSAEAMESEDPNVHQQIPAGLPTVKVPCDVPEIAVTLLTGGGDKPYVLGLATELTSKGATIDLIGSDELNCPELSGNAKVRFLNLRGDQRSNVGFFDKATRVIAYYAKLIRYAASAEPQIFHILWNNKFQSLDRTLLMLFYRLLGKRIALTVHNVNTARRDSKDTLINRATLRIQYQLSHNIFVHTEKMKRELAAEYGVSVGQITVIPFGINNTVPNSSLTSREAKQRLGIADGKRTILFFGNIAPYKGLEYLISAFQQFLTDRDDYRLVICGRPKGYEASWASIRGSIQEDIDAGRILLRDEYIPDEETEVYFKAADALALPYKHIYQSGVLFLGYSFGLPVLAADVGSLKDEIVEGSTGFVFTAEDPVALARAIEKYFESDLFANLNNRRKDIRELAERRHSWDDVGRNTLAVYQTLLRKIPKALTMSKPAPEA